MTILPGTTLDLDSLSGAGGDITYQTDENNNHPITPLENVLLGVYGASEPSKSACLAASLGNASIAIEVISPGTYLCFRTGEGRPGWLRIISLNTQDYAMALQVLTWVSP